MTPVKLIHFADLHYSKETQAQALSSLDTIYEQGDNIDLFAIAGDLFDRAVTNTDSSGLPMLQRSIQRLQDQAPVVAVSGTPTHDIPGCYDILTETRAKHSFVLLEPSCYYLLLGNGIIAREPMTDIGHAADERLLIMGCPEPSKSWFLAGRNGLSADEATQAVIDGMRKLFLGFGAVRKEFPNIPCLFLYHGQVKGASLCSGQTLPMGGIAVGADDLALIGADYYALGDIHLRQQIGDLPAWYSGSAYPINWSERDQKGFHHVTLFADRDWPEVLFYPFEHSPRIKVVKEYGHGLLDTDELAGKQVWLVVRGTREEIASGVTTAESLVAWGALPSSKVTTEVIPEEAVRASEIRDVDSLRAKLKVNAEANGEPEPGDSILEKADQLETEARQDGVAAQAHDWWLERIWLRGAIGIKKGIGLNEVSIDFNDFDPGIIGLLGDNGTGKTTLEENMHPFPCFISRSPSTPTEKAKLQDSFFLRDSAREVTYVDKVSGDCYRFLILVDGANASGSCEYHIFRNGKPLVNGRQADYMATVEELFGSIEMFRRSAVIAQKFSKKNPSLADANPTERKKIYTELAGIDYLQTYSEAAAEHAKTLEAEIKTMSGRIEAMAEDVAGMDGLAELVDSITGEIHTKQGIQKADEYTHKELCADRDQLAEKVEANKRITSRCDELSKTDASLATEHRDQEKLIITYQEAMSKREEAEHELREGEKIRAQITALEKERTAVLEERDQISQSYQRERQAVENDERIIIREIDQIRQEKAQKSEKRAVLMQKIDALDEKLQNTITCPNCHHAFVIGGEADEADLDVAQGTVWALDQDLEECRYREAEAMKRREQLAWPAEPEPPVFAKTVELQNLQNELDWLDVDGSRQIVEKAKEAEIRLEAVRIRLGEIEEQQQQNVNEVAQLRASYDDEADKAYQELVSDIATIESNLKELAAELAALTTKKQIYEEQFAALEMKHIDLELLREKAAKKKQDAAEWRYLERVCGRNGIQALELDAVAPDIMGICSRFLGVVRDHYDGCPFDSIKIETTRIAGKGSKTKQVEDFAVLVHDTRDDSYVKIEDISGGEDVWVTRALYDAFGVVRRKNAGIRFLTTLRDEADGALQLEAKTAYYRLLEAAHQESGCIHTMAITHSPDIQEMIGQRIVMTELAEPEPQEVR